jgi:hypothetical protein
MIGRNDERRKEEAVKKAEMALKKKEKEAVREMCVALTPPSHSPCSSDLSLTIISVLRCRRRCSSSTIRLLCL